MFRKWHAKKESGALQAYNERANEFARNSDSVTKKIFEDLVNVEEQHFEKYEAELENIEKFGENYLPYTPLREAKIGEQFRLSKSFLCFIQK